MSGDLAEFVFELGLKAKELSKEEQEKMSDIGKALAHAAEVDYGLTQDNEEAAKVTTRSSDSSKEADAAYLKQKIEKIKGK
ncbi:unnamed protein product [Cylicocyclus nassatus]|uniref:Uncharacterized protein n=1 Tax=Cylicocyclus nassatus TaxID=53992 RepID=A0AA36ME86_CYLNA|nr:unnamed protein product [Cylicocyclus nassatus]